MEQQCDLQHRIPYSLPWRDWLNTREGERGAQDALPAGWAESGTASLQVSALEGVQLTSYSENSQHPGRWRHCQCPGVVSEDPIRKGRSPDYTKVQSRIDFLAAKEITAAKDRGCRFIFYSCSALHALPGAPRFTGDSQNMCLVPQHLGEMEERPSETRYLVPAECFPRNQTPIVALKNQACLAIIAKMATSLWNNLTQRAYQTQAQGGLQLLLFN